MIELDFSVLEDRGYTTREAWVGADFDGQIATKPLRRRGDLERRVQIYQGGVIGLDGEEWFGPVWCVESRYPGGDWFTDARGEAGTPIACADAAEAAALR